MEKFKYVGTELELFANALNWKSYWISHLKHHIKGDVLEVGAGIGSNTKLLGKDYQGRWVCLEPDSNLFCLLKISLEKSLCYKNCEVLKGDITSLDKEQKFDTIIYIDVLEHIKEHKQELRKASSHLNPKGKLIVLSPAHQWLYTKFDKAIGHYRRYTRRSLCAITPSNLKVECLIYLDSVGLLASMGNCFISKQFMPSLRQIMLWDRMMIPCSRWIDPLTRYRIGKTVLAVWNLRS